MAALDIGVRQVLVDYFDDANFGFHHRLLMIPSGKEDGKWVALTPDHEAQVLDLNQFERVTPLTRCGAFPQRCVQYGVYGFDPFEDGEFDDCLRECRELAYVMGYLKRSGGDDVEGQRWRVADVTNPSFGETIPDDAWADDDQVVLRGKAGMIQIDDEWVFIQMVADDGFHAWQDEKFTKAIADPRVLPLAKGRGKRYRGEFESVALWTPLAIPKGETEPPRESSPFRGPPAAKEWFDSMRSAGLSLLTHHADFIRRAGVSEAGGVSREHESLMDLLRHAVTWDQLDGCQCAVIEGLVRRVIALELAVSRNPKAPDWEGLEHLTASRVTNQGVLNVDVFGQWLADRQRDTAMRMKQGRLLREEKAAAAKKSKE